MVRLSQPEIALLVDATRSCFGENALIYLFGSRVNDLRRGGDIDLAVETDLIEGIVPAKLEFRRLIWPLFGEQKIDLVVHSRSTPDTPILQIAKNTGVCLNSMSD